MHVIARDASRSVPPTGVTPVYVRETADGAFEVCDRGDAVIATCDALVPALDAARSKMGGVRRALHLHEGDEPVGVFRWLDASCEESVAEFPDGRLDRQSIEELAAFVNASPMALPVDGGRAAGLSESPVHGMSDDTATPANGWIHDAVTVIPADGVLHLYLRAELWPSIAQDVDRGRLAYGSVAVSAPSTTDDGAFRGTRLRGHALTNAPANRHLSPSTAVREATHETLVLRAGPSLLRSPMSKKSPKPAPIETKTEETPVVARADGEAPPPPAEETETRTAPATLEEAMVVIEQLNATIAAMQSELESRSAPAEDTEEKMAAKREADAVAAVDRAIADKRIAPAAKDAWLKVARGDVGHFETIAKTLRAVPERQTKGAATDGSLRPFDGKDPYVKAMRDAGVSDETIRRTLAARTADI